MTSKYFVPGALEYKDATIIINELYITTQNMRIEIAIALVKTFSALFTQKMNTERTVHEIKHTSEPLQ